jgi:hypothetical protein
MNPYFRSLVTLQVPAWFRFMSLVRTALVVCLLAGATNVQAQGWSATGSLGTHRYSGHTATLLANGKVLVVGGSVANAFATATAELYDPATGQWNATGSVGVGRFKDGARPTAAAVSTWTEDLTKAPREATPFGLRSEECFQTASPSWCHMRSRIVRELK